MFIPFLEESATFYKAWFTVNSSNEIYVFNDQLYFIIPPYLHSHEN